MGTTSSVQTFDSISQTDTHSIGKASTSVTDSIHLSKRDQTFVAALRNAICGCFATNGVTITNLPTVTAEPIEVVYVQEFKDTETMQVNCSETSSRDPHRHVQQQNTHVDSPKVNLRKRPLREKNPSRQPEINGFVLEKSLQNGYSGKVFLGYEKETNVPVVVKCCRKLSSWHTETKALSELQHENIIEMVGKPRSNVVDTSSVKTHRVSRRNAIGQENRGSNGSSGAEVHVLAQEYASNGDLYEVLHSHGPLDEATARALMLPIVKALEYAYTSGEGISHRDIKLENIFIAEDGTVKVGDWGLAAFQTRNRKCTSSCGTLGYMAPEMVCREAYDSNKTDVWALAVVLFSLTTGVRPYAEPQSRRKDYYDNSWRDEWLGAMIEGRWKLWWSSHAKTTPSVHYMSKELRDLLERMFCGDSASRASLAEVLAHPWMQGSRGEYEVTKADIVQLCRGY